MKIFKFIQELTNDYDIALRIDTYLLNYIEENSLELSISEEKMVIIKMLPEWIKKAQKSVENRKIKAKKDWEAMKKAIKLAGGRTIYF